MPTNPELLIELKELINKHKTSMMQILGSQLSFHAWVWSVHKDCDQFVQDANLILEKLNELTNN